MPLACASAYLAWVVARFPRIVEAIHLNPDAVWAPVLALDLGSGAKGGLIYVSQASHITSIWLLTATRWLPFRRLFWDWSPFLVFLAGLGLIAWAAWKVAGRWAAGLVLALGVAATPPVLLTVLPHGLHGYTFFADAVLGAFLVFYATKWKAVGPRARLAASGAVVLVAGATVASDPLFLVSGLVPFWVAAAVLAFVYRARKNRRFAVLVTVLAGSSLLVAVLIGRWMHASGYRKTYGNEGYSVAGPEQILRNARVFVDQVLILGNGYFFRRSMSVLTLALLCMALFLTAAAVAALAWTVRTLVRRRRLAQGDLPSTLHLLFWVSSGLATFGAFSLSSFAAGPSEPSRYIVPVFYALAAAVPVLCHRSRWQRVTAATGATLFCALSLLGRDGLLIYEQYYFLRSMDRDGSRVVSFLAGEGLTRGYAGYLISHPLTYRSDMRARVYPVIACRQPVSAALCPFSVNTRTAWYRPQRGVRSFVLFDAAGPALITPPPPPDLGAPTKVARFGDLSVFVYDYDVASRFAPGCPLDWSRFTCPER